MLQYVSVFFLYGDFIIYEQGKWVFSFIPQSEEGAYSMGRATFLSSDRPTVRPSIHLLNNLYKKACHVFTIQDIDKIFSGYLHHIKTQKSHKNFLGPVALSWAQGPK